MLFLFVTRKRDKNPYNPAKKPIAIFRENDFPICYFRCVRLSAKVEMWITLLKFEC
nr:hypothetical protein [uncultured bacterium]